MESVVPMPQGGPMVLKARPYSIAPTTFDEAVRFAELVAKSAFCPKEYRGKPGDILVAVEMGAEVGFRPMQALQSISVINGRPAIYGDGALGLVRATGELEDFDEHFDSEGEDLTAICMTKRRNERSPVTRRFSVAMAKRARLWGKQGPWTEYPQRMLQMRARSWTLRDGWADVLRGLHIWEEVQDIVETEAPTIAAATAVVHERLREKYAVPEAVPDAPPNDVPVEQPPESDNE
jgi:hypothetical protein